MKKTIAIVLVIVAVLASSALAVWADTYELGTYVVSVVHDDPMERFLNVRANYPNAPGGGYSTILGQIWNGTEVEIVEIVDDWGKFDFEGQDGWIRLSYTSFVSGSSTSEPSTEEPSTSEPSTEEPSTSEPSTEEPSTDDPIVPAENLVFTDEKIVVSDGIATGFAPNTKVETLASMIANTEYTVTGTEGNVLSDNDVIGTGVVISSVSGDSVVAVVLGDVDGSGVVDSTDYLRIKSVFLKTYSVEGAYHVAADADFNGEINATDYLQIKAHFLGTYNLHG